MSLIGIDIDFRNCQINQVRTLTDILSSKGGKLQIKSLHLNGNTLTSESLADLFRRASNSFQSLQILYIISNKNIKPDEIMTGLIKPSHQALSSLNLSGNYVGIPFLQALEDAVSAGQLAKLT